MKKVLLWVTAFTLGLASCQKSEVVDDVNAGSNELNFGVYSGKATRAGELTNKDLYQDKVAFPLHAYKGAQVGEKTKYFSEVLTYSTTPAPGKWNTSIPRFLTGDAPLQFYAYYAIGTSAQGVLDGATYGEPSDLKTSTYPTLKYTIKAPDDQVDLVAATVNDHTSTSVTIPFKHILSQVNFGVKGYYGAKIEIKNIVINQVYKDGTFSFNPDPLKWGWVSQATREDYGYKFGNATTAAASSFKTPGIGSGDTDALKEKERDYTYIFGDGGKWGPGIGEDTWYVQEDGNTIQGSKIIDGTTSKLKNSLMLMPQKLTADMTNAYVTFKYRICDLDPNKPGWIVGGADDGAANTDLEWEDGQFDLHMNDGTNIYYADEWKPNLRYVYIIDFTGFLDGQKLSFDVNVDAQPWENYNKPGDDDGIVLLSSLNGKVFDDNIKQLKADGTHSIEKGHLFSDITWNWSTFAMENSFAVDAKFTITFTDVKFNGRKITITPPFGFKVSSNAADYVNSIDVNATNITLTFKAALPYYVDAAEINSAVIADQNYEFNASNSVVLKDITGDNLAAGKTITLHFAVAYIKAAPANWVISSGGKTAIYTKPAAIVP